MIQHYNQPLPVCSYCLEAGHTAWRCIKKAKDKGQTYNGLKVSSSFGGQRKPMKRGTKRMKTESDQAKAKRQATSKLWYELNPPDNADGTWNYYLRISRHCEHTVSRKTINLEHMKNKVKHPELKYDVRNLKASCQPCNKLKWGTSLKDLAEIYPHLKKYV